MFVIEWSLKLYRQLSCHLAGPLLLVSLHCGLLWVQWAMHRLFGLIRLLSPAKFFLKSGVYGIVCVTGLEEIGAKDLLGLVGEGWVRGLGEECIPWGKRNYGRLRNVMEGGTPRNIKHPNCIGLSQLEWTSASLTVPSSLIKMGPKEHHSHWNGSMAFG